MERRHSRRRHAHLGTSAQRGITSRYAASGPPSGSRSSGASPSPPCCANTHSTPRESSRACRRGHAATLSTDAGPAQHRKPRRRVGGCAGGCAGGGATSALLCTNTSDSCERSHIDALMSTEERSRRRSGSAHATARSSHHLASLFTGRSSKWLPCAGVGRASRRGCCCCWRLRCMPTGR
jgi:hypothetical protein